MSFQALNVSVDTLPFEDGELDPTRASSCSLRRWRIWMNEREAVQTMIAGVLHIHDAKRWQQSATAPVVARVQAPEKKSYKPAAKRARAHR